MMTKAIQSPSKYIQGPGELRNLRKYVEQFGDKVFVVSDPFLFDTVKEILSESFSGSSLSIYFEKFGGEITESEVKRLIDICKEKDCNVVVGVGGGKTLDTAKAVSYYRETPVVIVPTAASTDAPCSALSVIYTEEGVFSHNLYLRQNPELVIVDTDIIVNAPVRLLVAGMGDALATYVEARANAESNSVNFAAGGTMQTLAAQALAKLCYDVILRDGLKAKLAVERKVCTKAVENIIEANTYLSGVGFESNGCAAAHAIHDGFTAISDCHHLYHGEKVAFGTLVELVLENRPMEEIEELFEFCISVGLPVTLEDMGIKEVTPEKIMKVAEAACAEGEVIYAEPFEITPKLVYDAILATDALGQMYKCKFVQIK